MIPLLVSMAAEKNNKIHDLPAKLDLALYKCQR